jgi:hypothetical protein
VLRIAWDAPETPASLELLYIQREFGIHMLLQQGTFGHDSVAAARTTRSEELRVYNLLRKTFCTVSAFDDAADIGQRDERSRHQWRTRESN